MIPFANEKLTFVQEFWSSQNHTPFRFPVPSCQHCMVTRWAFCGSEARPRVMSTRPVTRVLYCMRRPPSWSSTNPLQLDLAAKQFLITVITDLTVPPGLNIQPRALGPTREPRKSHSLETLAVSKFFLPFQKKKFFLLSAVLFIPPGLLSLLA